MTNEQLLSAWSMTYSYYIPPLGIANRSVFSTSSSRSFHRDIVTLSLHPILLSLSSHAEKTLPSSRRQHDL